MELSLVLENHSDTLHRFTGLLYRRGYTEIGRAHV